MQKLEQTFRWFGPDDQVTLADIRQTGATGIVTALHHVSCGDVWDKKEIDIRKQLIEEAGLTWSVIESINIHESIKTGSSGRDEWIEKYIQSLKNVSELGLKTVCYNFMPVLDWTRTDLDFRLPNKASALRYDSTALAAFDLFILEREEAFTEFDTGIQQKAKNFLDGLSKDKINLLTNTIMAGLPGTDEIFTVNEFREHLIKYKGIGTIQLKANLTYFLRAIIPVAEEIGIKMSLHPDDPPFPILGLPRVVCTEKDLEDVINATPSPANGITFCTGSLGANPANDLPGIIERLGGHIHFLHLRNVKREADGSFYEADHLGGDNDMVTIVEKILLEQKKRKASGRNDVSIPMRPDHGHKLLDDFHRNTYPGYSVIGRMKGLAELRGLEMGLRKALQV